MMSQQVMKIFIDYDYTISQSLDYRSYKFITLKQNYIDLMTQHSIKEVCNIDNNKSSKQSSATSTKFLGQLALIVTHIIVNMNSIKSRHMSKKQKKDKSLKH